jgi:hypothetical protein
MDIHGIWDIYGMSSLIFMGYLWDIYGIFMGFPTMICLGIHGYPIFRHILRSRPASDAHQRIAVRVRAEPFGHLIFCRIFKKAMSRTQGLWNSWNYMIIMISIIYKHIYIWLYMIYMGVSINGGSPNGWWSWFTCHVDPSRPHFSKRDQVAPALCSRARSLGASTFRFSWQLILSLHGNLKEHARWCPIVS